MSQGIELLRGILAGSAPEHFGVISRIDGGTITVNTSRGTILVNNDLPLVLFEGDEVVLSDNSILGKKRKVVRTRYFV